MTESPIKTALTDFHGPRITGGADIPRMTFRVVFPDRGLVSDYEADTVEMTARGFAPIIDGYRVMEDVQGVFYAMRDPNI